MAESVKCPTETDAILNQHRFHRCWFLCPFLRVDESSAGYVLVHRDTPSQVPVYNQPRSPWTEHRKYARKKTGENLRARHSRGAASLRGPGKKVGKGDVFENRFHVPGCREPEGSHEHRSDGVKPEPLQNAELENGRPEVTTLRSDPMRRVRKEP